VFPWPPQHTGMYHGDGRHICNPQGWSSTYVAAATDSRVPGWCPSGSTGRDGRRLFFQFISSHESHEARQAIGIDRAPSRSHVCTCALPRARVGHDRSKAIGRARGRRRYMQQLRASPTARSKPRPHVRLGRAGQKCGPTRGRTAKADGRAVRNDANPAQI
jgi:hypothetical protein